jgi:DNA-binding transcriptional MerR regulator
VRVTIGEVSKQTSTPASTIRFYERIGLLAPVRRVAGRRIFDEDDVSVLRLIRLARHSGFTLAKIRLLVSASRNSTGESRAFQRVVEAELGELSGKIQDLQRIEQTLAQALHCGCSAIHACDRLSAEMRSTAIGGSRYPP